MIPNAAGLVETKAILRALKTVAFRGSSSACRRETQLTTCTSSAKRRVSCLRVKRFSALRRAGTPGSKRTLSLAADFDGAAPELYSLRFDGKKRGWVVGSVSRGDNVVDSILAITRDGGATWQVLKAPSRQELIHIDFVDDQNGWIVGAGGAILRTTDAGESWKRQDSGTTLTLYHIDFRNKKQGLAVGERGTILATENSGETWSKVTSPARATLLSVQFVSEDDAWIIGRGGAVLRSGDGGRTWIEQESSVKQNLYAMFMMKKAGWVVGSDGLMLIYKE